MTTALAHFCDIHGPAVVFSTYEGAGAKRPAADASNSPNGCVSCAFRPGHGAVMIRSRIHEHTFLSTATPKTPLLYRRLRQSCLQSLSCEVLPTRTGPMLFGSHEEGGGNDDEEENGYTIAYVFYLLDKRARGGKRWYALLYVAPETQAVSAWTCVVRAFTLIADDLARRQEDEDVVASSGELTGFLRSAASKSRNLVDLAGDSVFVDLHANFARVLYQTCD